MPVYKDKKNTWYVSFTYKDVKGNFKKKIKRGFETKHESVMWELQAKLDNNVSVSNTFRELFLLQLDSMDATETTRQMKTQWLYYHFPFMDVPLNNISRDDFLEWRNGLKKSNLATRTINRGIQYVKSVCQFANRVYLFYVLQKKRLTKSLLMTKCVR